MPPAIIASPRLVTPSRAYCTAPTSRSPRPLPFLVCGCPLRKNFSRNGLCSEFSYLTSFQHFGFEGEDPLQTNVPEKRHKQENSLPQCRDRQGFYYRLIC